MEVTAKITITDDQLQEIENRLFERLRKADPNHGKSTKPYSVAEFSEATGIPESTIRFKIRANLLEIVEGQSPYKIKAKELERFM